MKTFAIRTIYFWSQKTDGNNVFEERVVAFHANDSEEAFAKAEKEAISYSMEREDLTYKIHPEKICYELDPGIINGGAEVWSEMYQSKMDLESFYQERYGKYVYIPE